MSCIDALAAPATAPATPLAAASAHPGVTLALGTVQFGLAYGIVGRGQAVPPDEAAQILQAAADLGVATLDTAAAYGDIEARLAGLCDLCDNAPFDIVSKIPPPPQGADATDAADWVTQTVLRSRERLGSRLGALLFHNAQDLLGAAGERLWRAAADAAPPGVRLGVSCYGPQELQAVCDRHPVRMAQLPGNALDQRLRGHHFPGVELHLRSVFLQGLLLSDPTQAAARVPAAASALGRWHRRCAQMGLNPLVAALGIARALPGVHCLVVGVDCMAQLQDIAKAWHQASALTWPDLATADPAVIDPREWPRG